MGMGNLRTRGKKQLNTCGIQRGSPPPQRGGWPGGPKNDFVPHVLRRFASFLELRVNDVLLQISAQNGWAIIFVQRRLRVGWAVVPPLAGRPCLNEKTHLRTDSRQIAFKFGFRELRGTFVASEASVEVLCH